MTTAKITENNPINFRVRLRHHDGDDIKRLREDKQTLDDLLAAIHRMRDIDRDTRQAETHLQDLIKHEFREMDDAIDAVKTTITTHHRVVTRCLESGLN